MLIYQKVRAKLRSSPLAFRVANEIRSTKNHSFTHTGSKAISFSDLFVWRNDNNLTTIFKLTDLPRQYLGLERSSVFIQMYNSEGMVFYEKECDLSALSSTFSLSEFIPAGSGEYGTFSVFFKFSNSSDFDFNPINRCYTGYKLNSSGLPSYCHGNFIAQRYNLSDLNPSPELIGQTTFRKNRYYIQRKFNIHDKNELAFTNPSKKMTTFSVNGSIPFSIAPRGIKIINFKEEICSIESNLVLPRPIAFLTSNSHLNCFHC